MTDIAKMLRGPATVKDEMTAIYLSAKDARRAADYVERLQKELARAKDALTPFAESADECDDYGWDDNNQAPVTAGDCRIARDVLDGNP